MMHLKDFFTKRPEKPFSKGDVLVHQDEAAIDAYYISDGFVKSYTIADDGDEKLISILGPGDVINIEGAFFQNHTHRYYFEAMSDGTARSRPVDTLKKELSKDQDALFGLIRYVMTRNDELAQTLENILQAKSDSKLINYLALLVQRFGQESKDGIVTLPFPLSHAQLASMVGTTRETMTVQLRELTKKGVLRAARRGIFRNRQSGFEINLAKLRELTDV